METNVILLAIVLIAAAAPTAVSTAGDPSAAAEDAAYVPCPEDALNPTIAKTRGQLATWVYGGAGRALDEDTTVFVVYPVAGEPTWHALAVDERYLLTTAQGARTTTTYTVYQVDGFVLTGQSLKCLVPPVATGTVHGNSVGYFAIDQPGIYLLHLEVEYAPQTFWYPPSEWKMNIGIGTVTAPTDVLDVSWQLTF